MLCNLFVNPPKKDSKFVAIYSDGSGAALFHKKASGRIYNAEGGAVTHDWLEDTGFYYWYPLPNKFKLFYERT